MTTSLQHFGEVLEGVAPALLWIGLCVGAAGLLNWSLHRPASPSESPRKGVRGGAGHHSSVNWKESDPMQPTTTRKVHRRPGR